MERGQQKRKPSKANFAKGRRDRIELRGEEREEGGRKDEFKKGLKEEYEEGGKLEECGRRRLSMAIIFVFYFKRSINDKRTKCRRTVKRESRRTRK